MADDHGGCPEGDGLTPQEGHRVTLTEARRPEGSNADEWLLFIIENPNAPEFLAVQIAEAIDDTTKKWRREIIELCEATEEISVTTEFERGRVSEAKGIRRAMAEVMNAALAKETP